MKKLSIILLSICFIGGLTGYVFAGGSKESSASSSTGVVHISMSTWGMPWESLLYTQTLIPQFEKAHPNIKIDFHRYDNYWTKLVTLAAGGQAPDVMRESLAFVGQQLQTKMLMPLDKFISGPDGIDMNQYVKGWYKVYSYLPHKYFIPVGINSFAVIQYNKALFRKAGVPFPSPNWTMSQFEATAKKLTTSKVAGFYWEIPYFMYLTAAYSTGAHFWAPGKQKFVYSDQLVNAFKLMQRWVFTDKITPSSLLGGNTNRENGLAMFESGQLAMFSAGGWEIPSVHFDAPHLDFGTVPFPSTADKGPGGAAAGTSWGMYAKTKHPNASWKLVKFLTSKNAILTYWRQTYVEMPASIPVRKSKDFTNITGIPGHVLAIQNNGTFNALLGADKMIGQHSWFYNYNLGPYFSYVSTPIQTALDKTIGKTEGNPVAAAKTMVEQINRAIKNSQY